MYIQCKFGFLEIDQWDGSPIPKRKHMTAIRAIRALDSTVFVVRSRVRPTLAFFAPHHLIFETPDWDYPFRCYMGRASLCDSMISIVEDLDYRNFKSWSKENSDADHAGLAHDLWSAALFRAGLDK